MRDAEVAFDYLLAVQVDAPSVNIVARLAVAHHIGRRPAPPCTDRPVGRSKRPANTRRPRERFFRPTHPPS